MKTDINAQSLPLAGVKILDLTRLLPGPLCTLFLAELGAEVLKVEDTDLGDYTRHIPPLLHKESYLFHLLNRNKKSLSVNLQKEEGKKLLHRLVPSYDVVIESFRPGVTKKLGINYETLSAIHPTLVYCSLTGYGQTGPYKDMAGHDLNYISLTGLLEQMGAKNGPPIIPAIQVADIGGGALMAALAVASAVLKQKIQKLGSYLDVSMMDGTLSLMLLPFVSLLQGKLAARGEDILTGGTPCYHVYETADRRYMSVGIIERKFWVSFCGILQRPDWIPLHLVQGEKAQPLREELERLFKSHPQAYWIKKFEGTDCCVTPVLNLEEALQHPQVQARNIIQRLSHPVEGEISFPTFPVKIHNYASFSGQSEQSMHSGSSGSFSPRQGEQTEAVLRELGLSSKEIQNLVDNHIVRVPESGHDHSQD